jgi:HEPN domain-containing protein
MMASRMNGRSPEQSQDDNARTTSIGLFNLAEAYRLSARRLQAAPVKVGFAESPILFLYYHALELYLKALLRQKHGVQTLSGYFGHKIQRLVEEAEALGLTVTDEDREVFSLMADTDAVIDARYLRTGHKRLPALEVLNRTSANVHNAVATLLRKADLMVRPGRA